ncbi:hypothetical protein AAKU55_002286 [Oxalobacteraceae bacterium GrIS 1.11]
MTVQYHYKEILAVLLGAATFGLSASAMADPPGRVARLAYSSGAVSFSPAGDDAWVQAALNRPLIAGDRLWADAGAQEEVQIGSAALRMDGNTLLTVLNVDDRTMQLQLSQGRLNLRVRHLDANDVVEIDTPNLAFSIRAAGDYRVEVDPQGNATTVLVRNGQAEAYGEGNAYRIDPQQSYRFTGTDLHDYQLNPMAGADELDRWTVERDRRVDNSPSARYVSREVTGYSDLDDNGTWRTVSGYGNVWVPSHVAAGWAPYHDGHWAWVEPWGWTWVDDAPWGFAVSHYGRWTNMQGSWGWVPGPVAVRPVYAPALVVFIGGGNGQAQGANMAWFPLAPREVYQPSYHVSKNYINNINVSNTTINKTQITNVYNTNVTNVTYVNRQVTGAVVAVPTTAFIHAQPVGKAAVTLPKDVIARAPLAQFASVAPDRVSLSGNGAAGHKPAAAVLARPVMVKTAPPPAPAPFAARQAALSKLAGRPLEPASMPVGASKPAPQFKVLHPIAAGVAAGKPLAPPPPPPVAAVAGHPAQPVTAAVAGHPVQLAAAPGQPARPTPPPAGPLTEAGKPGAAPAAQPVPGAPQQSALERAKAAAAAHHVAPAPAAAPAELGATPRPGAQPEHLPPGHPVTKPQVEAAPAPHPVPQPHEPAPVPVPHPPVPHEAAPVPHPPQPVPHPQPPHEAAPVPHPAPQHEPAPHPAPNPSEQHHQPAPDAKAHAEQAAKAQREHEEKARHEEAKHE